MTIDGDPELSCRRDVPRTGRGHARGTFGELLQGVLAENDLDFLVTLPIRQGTTTTFRPESGSHEVEVRPAHKLKARRLANLIVSTLDLPCGGLLEVESTLPEGKGLASSSADLVATALALGDSFGLAFDGPTIESFLRRIEPTDGVMYLGVVAYYHRAVRLREHLGFLPRMTVVGYDEGGVVDTVGFNRTPKPYGASEKLEYSRLLAELSEAVRAADLAAVGRVATRSAAMNAAIRPRSGFGPVRALCREVDGFGVVTAHSGTMLGVLLAEDDPEAATKTEHIRQSLRRLPGALSVHHTLNETASHPARRPPSTAPSPRPGGVLPDRPISGPHTCSSTPSSTPSATRHSSGSERPEPQGWSCWPSWRCRTCSA